VAGSLSLPTLVQAIKLDTGGVTSASREAEQSLSRAGSAAGRLDRDVRKAGEGFKLSSILMAVGTTAIVIGLKKAVDAGVSYAATVRNIKAVTGGTAEDSSKLAFVLDRVGIGADKAARPFSVLSRNIQQGGDRFKQYFTAAELADLKTRSLIQTIPLLQKKYQALNTAQEKSTFLTNVFADRQGKLRALLALSAEEFGRIADEASKFGLVLTEQNLQAFKQFAEGQRAVTQAFKGLQVQVGVLTLPVMERFNELLVNVINTISTAPGPVKEFAAGVGLVGFGLLQFGQGAVAAFQILRGVVSLVGKAGGVFLDWAGKISAPAQSLNALADNADSVADAVSGVEQTVGVAGDALVGADVAARAASRGLAAAGGAAESAAAGFSLAGAALTGLVVVAAGVGLGLIIKQLLDAQKAADAFADKIAGRGGDSIVAQMRALEKERERLRKATDTSDFQRGLRGVGAGGTGGIVFPPIPSDAEQRSDALTRKLQSLKQAQIESSNAANLSAKELRIQGDQFEELSTVIGRTVQIIGSSEFAQARLENALDGVAISSEAGRRAITSYAQALISARLAATSEIESDAELKKIRAEAAGAAVEAALKIQEAQVKAAAAADEARAKQIAANAELLFSFDLLRDKAKEGLDELISSTQANTADFLKFFDGLTRIAAAGAPVLAQQLAAMGPKGAKAVSDAVALIGSDVGLGKLEAIAVAAALAAKQGVDKQFNTWPVNFADKADQAVLSFEQGLAQLPDKARAAIGPPIKVEINTDDVDPKVARTVQSLNDIGLLKPLVRIALDPDAQDDFSQSLLQTRLSLLGITEAQWNVILATVAPQLRETGDAIDATAAKKREAKIDTKAPNLSATSASIDAIANKPRRAGINVGADVGSAAKTIADFVNKPRTVILDIEARIGASVGRVVAQVGAALVPKNKHAGGLVMHGGGPVPLMHAGGLRADEVDVRVQRGEFVVNRESTRRHLALLNAINAKHNGGLVAAAAPARSSETHVHFHGGTFIGTDMSRAGRDLSRALDAHRRSVG
jgi:hypothetical protein